MLRYHFLLSWRNLKKRKLYSAIEVVGLAVGITSFVLIALYIRNELSYDRFFSHSEEIYRMINVEQRNGNRYSGTSSALSFHAQREIPPVRQVARVFYPYRMFSTTALIERNPTVRFYEDNLLVADSTFFQVFDFQFTEGNSRTALLRPDAIVLSKQAARKYFGTSSPLNQTLRINQGAPLTVTGVVDVPHNTHLNFDFLRPVHSDPTLGYVWEHTLTFAYMRVENPADIPGVEQQLYQIVLKHSRNHQIDFLKNYRNRLQPLREIHTTALNWDIIMAVPATQLWAVGIIAVFILLLAIVNFINLATARSVERVKEVGMNKVLGATNRQLITRYLCEALLISLAAGVISVGLIHEFIPAFNRIAQTSLEFHQLMNSQLLGVFLLFLTVTGVMAGLYPAYILSRFKPTEIVKRSFTASPGQRWLREGLVVFQFVITIGLLIGTFIVQGQIRYMQETDLGFNKDQILVLRIHQPGYQKFERLKAEFLSHAGILKVAGASTPVGSETGSQTFKTPEMPDETPENFAKTISVDPDFLDLMGIPLLQGRNFLKGPTDLRNRYIVNETLVRRFNLKSPFTTSFSAFSEPSGQIVGVIKDFHFASLTEKIDALVLNLDTVSSYRYAFVKLAGGQINASVRHVREVWQRQNPDFPIEYFFQDEHFNQLYRQQEQIRQIVSYFTGLALLLACLGLFGLSSFVTARRTKEIGIRKVLGATVTHIVALLSRDFLRLVLLANLMAWPLAWWAMSQWLEDFAYRIEIGWWIFLVAGGVALLIAVLTVSLQAIKAALANPVKSMRTE